MFYSVFVLGKKGPLARVWLAAHWDKKITKAQILETNIVESVDSILAPKGAVKLSLRTSSHLLLGIVRIYARKTLYLLQDCQDAAFKIKSAFRPGVVDLPDGKTEAAISAITLPEMFDFINDFDLMPEPQLQLDTTTTTANIRNITLMEDISSIHVDDPLLMNEGRDWSEIGSIGGGSINIKDTTDSTMISDSSISIKNNFDMFDRPALDDGFGGQLGVGIVDDDDVFGMTMPTQEDIKLDTIENGHNDETGENSRPNSRMSAASSNMSYGGPASMGVPSSIGSPSNFDDVEPFNSNLDQNGSMDINSLLNDGNTIKSEEPENAATQNTMVLEPIDSQHGGLERKRKRRKKIGVAIDEVKTLSGEEMKAQLSDTSDIISNLELAPPNKMLMNWKKTGLSDKLFSLPERTLSAKVLFQYYSRNLITSRFDCNNENDFNEDDLINHDVIEDEAEHLFRNGRMNTTQLPELEDVDMHLQQYQEPEFQAPKTPRAPKSPAPPRKKRKTEDKENKEVTKHTRETSSKYEKYNHNDTSQQNDSTLLHDISSIPQGRDASADLHNNTDTHYDPHPNQINEDEEDEDKDEVDDFMLDDYGAPMSVGPPEEMLPDETIDQYEERVRTKRSNLLLKYMSTQLDENGFIKFSTLITNNRRKLVAQKFYALLVLKKQMAIELYQDATKPYSELTITKGENSNIGDMEELVDVKVIVFAMVKDRLMEAGIISNVNNSNKFIIQLNKYWPNGFQLRSFICQTLWPILNDIETIITLALNMNYLNLDESIQLSRDDIIALIPPISGG